MSAGFTPGLVERLSDFNRRVQSIPESGMSPTGQGNALALLLALNVKMLRDCEAALRGDGIASEVSSVGGLK